MLRKVSLAALLLAETVFSASLFAFPSLTIKSAFENSVKTKKGQKRVAWPDAKKQICSQLPYPELVNACLKSKKKEKPNQEKKKEKTKEEAFWEDFEKNSRLKQGLFNIYKKDEKFFMEISSTQFNRNYLYSSTIERGTGERKVYQNVTYENYVWYFRKIGDNVQFVKRNTGFRADPNTPIGHAVEVSFQDAVIATAKIAGPAHPEKKSALIELNDIFLSDLDQLGGYLSDKYKSGYSFNREGSYFQDVDVFPINIEMMMSLSFFGSASKPSLTLPDDRNIELIVRRSLSALPDEEGFEPRQADPRVGHFYEAYRNYSDLRKDDPVVRVIGRWRLEKKDPKAELSPPKKPIVWYLENTIPNEYRQILAAGILAWNKAFEKIGFKDVIEVRQQPDNADWKPGDIRHNIVRWFVNVDYTVAYAASRANPLTGEIYHATVHIADSWTRWKNWLDYHDFPIGQERSKTKLERLALCDYAQGLMSGNKLATAVLHSRGALTPELRKRFLDEALTELITHEIGHTLGLMHNFAGSSGLKLKDIQENRTGGLITHSIMDYTAPNLVPRGMTQGPFFQTRVGPYDEWAIEYAYSPVYGTSADQKEQLERIVAKGASNRNLLFATDDDADFGRNPWAARHDLSDDPLAYQKQQIERAREVFKYIAENEKADDRPTLTSYFNFGMWVYSDALRTAMRYIGGVRYDRSKLQNSGAETPFEPVPAGKQREALKFIDTNILREGVLDFEPKLLKKLAPPYEGFSLPLPQNANERIEALYQEVITSLFDPQTLGSIKVNESLTDRDQKSFTNQELFSGVHNIVWQELKNARVKVAPNRRMLQQIHLEQMIALASNPKDRPVETSALARNDLETIYREVSRALASKALDKPARVHLEDVKAKIKQTFRFSKAVPR